MDNLEKPRGGRPRAFDPDRALDAAMHLFWEHGYEATSLAMLREAMGLTPPQIYNAFTDKETLFRKALTRYHETEIGFALEALSAPVSTREAIRRLLLGRRRPIPGPASPAAAFSSAVPWRPRRRRKPLRMNSRPIARRVRRRSRSGWPRGGRWAICRKASPSKASPNTWPAS